MWLIFSIVPLSHKLQKLVKNVERSKTSISTGLLIVPFLTRFYALGPVCLLESSFLLESEFQESIFRCLVV